MRFLLLNTEGHEPSGVATFCARLGSELEGCFVASLNCDSGAPRFPREILARREDSHDARRIVERVMEEIPREEVAGKRWVALPNVGDTCYAAALGLRAALLARGAAAAAILGVCHSDDENQFKVLRHFRESLGAAAGVSPAICGRLARDFADWPPGRLFELPYPLPARLPRRRTVRQGDALVLAYAGRLVVEQKRIDRLPALAELLLAKGVAFRLEVLGDGRDRDLLARGLEALRARTGWSDYRLRGALDERALLEALAGADIAILHSDYEGSPLSLIEAMAVGTYPVAMDASSFRGSVFEAFATLCPAGDLEAMASAIARLDADRAELGRLAASAREAARGRFSIEQCASRLRQAAESALANDAAVASSGAGTAAGFHDAAIGKLMRQLDERPAGESVAVFGSGMFGRKLVDAMFEAGRPPRLLIDSDARRWGAGYRGIACVGPEAARGAGLSCVVVASVAFAEEMAAQAAAEISQNEAEPPAILSLDRP